MTIELVDGKLAGTLTLFLGRRCQFCRCGNRRRRTQSVRDVGSSALQGGEGRGAAPAWKSDTKVRFTLADRTRMKGTADVELSAEVMQYNYDLETLEI
jgi:hypothetical protein